MAFGRLERSSGPAPISDINMTPLIDVMLVLLVIFMIAAPLMTASLKLDLPRSEAARPDPVPAFIAVALTPAGELFLGDEKLAPEAFAERVSAAARQNPELEVQLQADRSVPYGQVAELIGTLQLAGLHRIAFVAQPQPQPQPQPQAPAASR
ncbi:biopolymer transporter ExbD [Aquabacterium sp. A7-Y]|uniref:ExbD/TolR family protein n=1 Tax=Aquabacterium sp. A7-Y TaxID=1349605 RepID=UPI00223E81C8|nr:biopolymer transporter ExbD [Aquabacterium sp. A7-Y]MCW7536622.1 biopolymer transporter ExbD [Aquabacterium sp. A7-Y]